MSKPRTETTTIEPEADHAPSWRKRLRQLPADERRRAREVLGLSPGRGGQLQPGGERRHVRNPQRAGEVVNYFRRALVEAGEVRPERVVTKSGRVEYVSPPTPPPTLEGFAASIGISRQTLYDWARKDPAFAEALAIARTIQAAAAVRLAAVGAFASPVAPLLLKHLADWVDSVDARVAVGVQIEPIPTRAYLSHDEAPPIEAEYADLG